MAVMTQKKQLPEQIASHTYRRRGAANAGESVERARAVERQEQHNEASKGKQGEVFRTRRRVVTTPKADPSIAWNTFAERQEQRRRARVRQPGSTRLVQRTYAQTGSWAPGGRTRITRRPLPSYRGSPIPTRSGQQGSGVRCGFLWKLLGVFTSVVMLILAAGFAFTSNAFRIQQVDVIGTHNDTLIRNIQRMGMQGQNIFLLNIPELEARIEALAFVNSASLSKQLPNRLTVTVVERVPVLLWQTPQGTYSVDHQGIVIAQVSETSGVDRLKTVIVGVDSQNKGNGQKGKAGQSIRSGMHLDQAEIAFALDVFNRLPQVTGIDAFKLRYDGTMYANTTGGLGTPGSKGSFIVESSEGWIAYLGGANDANPLENRLVELQQILALARQQKLNLATVDLRYGLHAVYTVK